MSGPLSSSHVLESLPEHRVRSPCTSLVPSIISVRTMFAGSVDPKTLDDNRTYASSSASSVRHLLPVTMLLTVTTEITFSDTLSLPRRQVTGGGPRTDFRPLPSHPVESGVWVRTRGSRVRRSRRSSLRSSLTVRIHVTRRTNTSPDPYP